MISEHANIAERSTTPIRVGMIGLGRFSRYHLKCLKQQQGVVLAAVADPNRERTEEVAAEWGCRGYEDWRRMLEDEALDAVVVLTPEDMHTEPVLKALASGCHVFVEKPLALTEADARRMVRTAEERGKLLMVGHVGRFDPRIAHIRREVEAGSLGKLRSVYCRRNNPKKYFHIYRRSSPIYVLGIHDIDLMHWVTGSRVVEVFARASASADGAPDLVWSMLTFADGTIGIIENHWLMPDSAPAEMDIRMEVVGEAGTIHLQDPVPTLESWTGAALSYPASYSWNELHDRYTGHLLEEMTHFYACVRANKPSTILRPHDALEAVKVAEAIVRSCETGLPVKLP